MFIELSTEDFILISPFLKRKYFVNLKPIYTIIFVPEEDVSYTLAIFDSNLMWKTLEIETSNYTFNSLWISYRLHIYEKESQTKIEENPYKYMGFQPSWELNQ